MEASILTTKLAPETAYILAPNSPLWHMECQKAPHIRQPYADIQVTADILGKIEH
eukprot:c27581_g1_i3 orf=905-1069(+)